MKKLLIVTIFIIAFTHNCMTFFTSYNWKKEPSSRIYSGTAANVQLIFNGPIQGQWSVLFPMALIDFPFSFTADTVLLPYHGFYAILYGLAEISKEDSNTPKRNEYEKKYPAYSKFEKAIKDNNLESLKTILENNDFASMERDYLKLFDDRYDPITYAIDYSNYFYKRAEAADKMVYSCLKNEPDLLDLFFKRKYHLVSQYDHDKSSYIWEEKPFWDYALKTIINDGERSGDMIYSVTANLNIISYYYKTHNKAMQKLNGRFLRAAILNHSKEIITLILKNIHDARKLEVDEDLFTFLLLEEKDVYILEDLLKKGLNPNQVYDFNLEDSYLISAIKGQNLSAVKVLLKYKANPNLVLGNPDWPIIPLHTAIQYSDHPDKRNEIIRELLKAGANRFRKDEDGKTALMRARSRGDMPDVERILSR
ncbi:MAG TPA: ankyrin repeat domain-containing protein [Leptospiraceae bacterium]|nr:ankyrin repeat domain-containing protein [Leptospiraceae bacterium]HMZ57524.1 ankyrin repeat domain-containing protein [Leptospiraceae bacterium]HNF12386.1 ankyrin repeat domain-containing protein [Leptospiraceae bacterium]HNN06090.1 ankyrin repeat domain-containing protein [Leptospiraceae bacterium]HNO22238.1 ankyrin repeat domain-containing protein [Leptospiraceae bacterium]